INDSNGEVIPAADFLPAAERFNMMPGIDRWVISNTIEKLIFRGCVTDAGQYMLSVNLSGSSLSDPSFLDFAYSKIKQAKIRPDSLCIEITETAAIANIDTAARFIRDMRQLGCRFSLDDFGSGLSSFAYLKDLPVDFLKIDGRFVRNIDQNRIDHSMVQAIGNIGAAMGLRTVAERVESKATLIQLENLGIDFAQGYLFAKPAPVVDRGCLARLVSATDCQSAGNP
ncbi:MAG: EAL domain-containing protein, partial [Gammaproteobacteria bacterium]|nr:EAL domain-containing protein [Gammaproteobacteria bacterium]